MYKRLHLVYCTDYHQVNEYLMELMKDLKIPQDNSGYDGNGMHTSTQAVTHSHAVTPAFIVAGIS